MERDPSTITLPAGTMVGAYRITRLIARGGMGAVYEAEQATTGATRALKLMHAQLADDDKLRRQFVQEARVAATIRSDHVAQVLDAGVDEPTGHLYLVMELLDGVTMSRALKRRGHFPWAEVAEILRQMSHGLGAAHDAGVVHRDLKPANVFFATPRTVGVAFMVKLLDFGIAKIVAEASPADAITTVLGTPAWMAPEQTEASSDLGPTADVWSMGLLAFTLLTGKHFWPSANQKGATATIIREIVIEEIPPASVRAAGYELAHLVPPGFDAWMSRCVTRRPEDRYPNARAAYDAFVELVGPACAPDSEVGVPGLVGVPSTPSWSLVAPAPSEPPTSVRAGTPDAGARFDRPTVSHAARLVPVHAAPARRRWPIVAAAGALAVAGAALAAVAALRLATPKAAEAGAATAPAAGASAGRALLRIHGSNTIGAELVPSLAEAYLKRRSGGVGVIRRPVGDEEVRVETRPGAGAAPEVIEVQAHGSATAFESLARGDCDVGMSSRRINAAELEKLSALGNMASAASEHVIALDGIAVIVNPDNRVASLSKDQIARVFSGELTKWSEVGGGAGEIKVAARDDRSGTYDSFRAMVLGKRSLAPGAARFSSSEHLSDAVAADAGTIGFIGLPYVRSAKPVMVQDEGSTAVLPSPMTVATEDYPLARRLYLYAPHGASDEARRFVDFAMSEEGQQIAERAGFVDLRPECDAGASACATCTRAYRDAVASACRLSVDFRFDFAAKQLDTRGVRDLARVSALLARPDNAARAVVLLGFSDDVGTRAENLSLSRERAEIVAAQLRARGLRVSQVRGFGPEMPVASNATPDGRERNRRVEIWLR